MEILHSSHEALDRRRPKQVHEKSNRIYTGEIESWDYDAKLDVRIVTANGHIRWKRDLFPKWIPVGTSLSGPMVRIIEFSEAGQTITNMWYTQWYQEKLLNLLISMCIIGYGEC